MNFLMGMVTLGFRLPVLVWTSCEPRSVLSRIRLSQPDSDVGLKVLIPVVFSGEVLVPTFY